MPKKTRSYAKPLKVRGGYAATPNPVRKSAPVKNIRPFGKVVDNTPTNSLGRAKMNKKVNRWTAVSSLLGLAAYIDRGIRADGGYNVFLKTAVDLGTGTTAVDKKEPLVQSSSEIQKQPAYGAVAPTKVHKVSLETGRKPTNSIKKFMDLNGSTVDVILDTMKNPNFQNNTRNLRDSMQLHGGFNQKLVYTNYYFQTSIQDIFDMYKWNENTMTGFSTKYTQKFYGIAKHLTEQIRISNLNAYNAVDVKIHLVAADLDDSALSHEIPYYKVIESVASTNTTATTRLDATLPHHKVIRAASTFVPYYSDGSAFPADSLNRNYAHACYLDPKAQIRQSPRFNDRYTIIHTVKKRLEPGDEFDFTNKIGLGAGLPLHNMYTTFQRTKSADINHVSGTENYVSTPIAYHYVLEVVGQKTIGKAKLTTGSEASSINKEKFLGTAPFMLQVECRRTMELANKTAVVSSSATDGFDADQYPIKVFTGSGFSEPVALTTPFNKDFGSTQIEVKALSDDAFQPATTI